ncbi:hypothetical protein OIU34_33975 [Pararhizobium sp. BT-229]|nr:hypothetical protein [Pararhizobium sp. BT-229]MCV9966859.1 hypothetical protein [Pararhizobium sp. BT-229]
MRSFWGLMSAYWLSESWREAWEKRDFTKGLVLAAGFLELAS